MTEAAASPQMWATLVLTGLTLVLYAIERVPVELTALLVLGALLLLFHFMPLPGDAGLGPDEILAGFANPALLAVLALLVIGQAMINTAALDGLVNGLARAARGSFRRVLIMSLATVTGTSGLLNNTPVVVIFLPIMRTLAERFTVPASAVMIPLSFAAVMGGMLTLIGSSSNLLVSGELVKLGRPGLGFFDITLTGLVLCAAASLYILNLPRFLPRRGHRAPAAHGRQFIAEIDVVPGSPLVGQRPQGGMFPALGDVTVRLIQRSDGPIVPPFEDVTLEEGDVLIVAATRKVLAEMLKEGKGQFLLTPTARARGEQPERRREPMIAEAMVKPASRLIGQSVEFTTFAARTGCTLLGIQRRARMHRTRLAELRLEPGDVLLLLADLPALERLRSDPDVLLMEWSAAEMPHVRRGPLALAIFGLVVATAALEILPIVTSALIGAGLLIATGCINLRQASRAIDRRIVLLIAAALALGTALEATGGALYLAGVVLDIMAGSSPAMVLSAFFLLMAVLTNVLSNNACAVLFTPIAVSLARGLHVDVFPFALAVVFASNCSFATPFGYQVNLLVMGPGQYRFLDFVRAGVPLILILWLVFSLFVPWYYEL